MTDKHHKTQQIKHQKRHHKWLMAPFLSARSVVISVVLMSAVFGGIYTILNSSAASQTYGSLGIRVLSASSGGPLSGVWVQITGWHLADSEYGSTWTTTSSCINANNVGEWQPSGYYWFNSCYVHTATKGVMNYYVIDGVSLTGWHVVGGGATVGTQYTIHTGDTGSSPALTIYMAHDAPATPAITGADRAQNQITLHWNAASGAEGYSTYKNGGSYGSTSLTSYTFAGLTCNTTYSLGVAAYASGTPSGTSTQSFSTTACPAAATPAPAPSAPVPAPAPAPVKNTTSTSRVVTRTASPAATPAVTASTDSQPPSTPTNLTATEGSSGSIDLAWSPSTDDTGVTAYMVERSDDDGQTWTTLTDNTQDTNYTDDTTDFATKYTYRVSALDAAGNASDYAVIDITTSSFSANAYADKDSTIASDDGIVSVKIPKGALSEDAACEINQSSDDKSVSKAGTVLAGAYELVCKTADGTQVGSFDKALDFKVTVSKQMQKSKPQLYVKDNGKWTNSKLKLSNGAFNFSTDSPKPFAIIGNSGGLSWLKLLLGLFLIIGAIFGIFTWSRRRRQLNDYYDGLNSQYAASTPVDYNGYQSTMPQPVGNVPDPFMPQPIPEPTAAPDQEIGHRTVFSPAIGAPTQPQAQPPQVPTQPQIPQQPAGQPQDPNNPYNQPPAGPQPPA